MTEEKLIRDETLEECCRSSILATQRALEEGLEVPPTIIFIDSFGSATPVLAYNVSEGEIGALIYDGAHRYKAERICLVMQALQAEICEGELPDVKERNITPEKYPDRFHEVVTCIVSDRFQGSIGGYVRLNRIGDKKVFATAPEVRPAHSDFFEALWKKFRTPKEELN
jgi:hypothetical protein